MAPRTPSLGSPKRNEKESQMSEKVEIPDLGIFEAQVFCIAQIDCDGALTDSAYFADKLGSLKVLAEVGKF